MIQAKNIFKKYDQLQVLKGVDLHIKSGEIVSIWELLELEKRHFYKY